MSDRSGTVTRRTLGGEATVDAHLVDESAVSVPSAELALGTTIDRYVIVSRLGAGAMGVVYGAYDPKLDRKVAIKVLRSNDPTPRSERRRARLAREAKALARIAHPNVVTVFDVGTLGERVWVAMEFVEGVTLRRWLATARPSIPEVLDVLTAAGWGLEAAHGAGLVHRDFKPDNVMVEMRAAGTAEQVGRVLVMDFGLARADTKVSGSRSAVDDADAFHFDPVDSALLTQHGDLVGTPAYMAPEQHLAEDADARSDQFAFCLVLWEALFGERPFGSGPPREIGGAVLEGRRRPPPAGHDVPPWLLAILDRGLQPSREERFASMAEVLQAIERGRMRRRRRGVVASIAVAGGLALAGVGGWHAWVDGVRSACAAEGAEIQDTWPGRAGEVERALSPHASVYEKTKPWLDRWTQRWTTVRADVCELTEVHGRLQPTQARGAVACLDQQRTELSALLDALATGDTEVAQEGVIEAASLPRPETCVDADRLARGPWPSERQWEEVERIRRQLASLRLQLDVGIDDDARSRAESLVEAAQAVQWPAVEADAMALAGWVARAQGRYDEAEEWLERAYWLAGEAGADELAIGVATTLVAVVGHEQARHEAGLTWAGHAQMMLNRVGGEHDLRRARLLNAMGLIEKERGNLEVAEEHLKLSDALYAEVLGSTHPERASTLTDLGNLHLARADFDKARQLHRRARSIWESVLGPTHPRVANSIGNEALVDLRQGDVEAASRRLEEVTEIFRESYGPEHPEVGRSLLNLGSALRSLSQLDEALAVSNEARGIFEKSLGPEHPLVAAALNNLGLIEESRGDYDRALEHYRSALEIKRASLGERHPNLVSTLGNIGVLHRRREEYAEAQEAYEQALVIAEDANGPDHLHTAVILDGLGDVFVERGEPAKAIPYLQRALDIRDRHDGPIGDRADTRFSLAVALWEDSKTREPALELARRALAEVDGLTGKQEAAARMREWLAERQ